MSRKSAPVRRYSSGRQLGSVDAEEERRSVSFLGLHKSLSRSDENGTVSSAAKNHKKQERTEHQNQDQDQDQDQQPSPSLPDCFVLLPLQGVARIPARGRACRTVELRRQLELQTGFPVCATGLHLPDGRELGEDQDPPTEESLFGGTLRLGVRHEYHRLLLECLEADSTKELGEWLAAERRRSLRGEGHGEIVALAGLLLACCRDNLEYARLILRAMPSLAESTTPITGRTALHFACYHERPRLCRLLLSRMRRPAVARRDIDGRRAVDYAEAGSPCRRMVGQQLNAAGVGEGRAPARPATAGQMTLFQLPLPQGGGAKKRVGKRT